MAYAKNRGYEAPYVALEEDPAICDISLGEKDGSFQEESLLPRELVIPITVRPVSLGSSLLFLPKLVSKEGGGSVPIYDKEALEKGVASLDFVPAQKWEFDGRVYHGEVKEGRWTYQDSRKNEWIGFAVALTGDDCLYSYSFPRVRDHITQASYEDLYPFGGTPPGEDILECESQFFSVKEGEFQEVRPPKRYSKLSKVIQASLAKGPHFGGKGLLPLSGWIRKGGVQIALKGSRTVSGVLEEEDKASYRSYDFISAQEKWSGYLSFKRERMLF